MTANRPPVESPATGSTVPLGDEAEQLARMIALGRRSQRIVAFTGAGISTESGIPDYRGPNGVWARQAPPTLGDFRSNSDTRRAYWQRRRETYPKLRDALPNPGHAALVTLERAGRLVGIITQNIDGLHQKAGSDPGRVVELHGSAHQIRCLECGSTWPAGLIHARLLDEESVPACTLCGGSLRAATVLFGEPLPAAAWQQAGTLSRLADLMLVIGTSLIVNPAARLPVLGVDHGAALAIINRTPTPLDSRADVRVVADAGPTLAAFAAAVLEA